MPQPIDHNTEVARAAAVERIQQVADRASLAAQRIAAEHAEREQVDAETRVKDTQETENPELDGDGRRRTPYSKRKGKRKKSDQSEWSAGEEPVIDDDSDRHRLDVSI